MNKLFFFAITFICFALFAANVNAQDGKEFFKVQKIDPNYEPIPMDAFTFNIGNSGFFVYDVQGFNGEIQVVPLGLGSAGTSYRMFLQDVGNTQYFPFVALGKALPQSYTRPSQDRTQIWDSASLIIRYASAYAGDTGNWNSSGLATIGSTSYFQTVTMTINPYGVPIVNKSYKAFHSGAPGGTNNIWVIYLDEFEMYNGSWILYDPGTGTLQIPNIPTGLMPSNGYVFQAPTACLSWDQVSGLVYWVEISSDPNFQNIVYSNNNVSSNQICTNLSNGFYWWRISAKYSNQTFWSGWTVIKNFQVQYTVGIEPNGTEIPKTYQLYQNYPNPFNPITKIKFDLPSAGITKVEVIDITGKLVKTLVNEEMQAGSYTADFDGSKLSSGVYFYRIVTTGFTDTKKMVLIK